MIQFQESIQSCVFAITVTRFLSLSLLITIWQSRIDVVPVYHFRFTPVIFLQLDATMLSWPAYQCSFIQHAFKSEMIYVVNLYLFLRYYCYTEWCIRNIHYVCSHVSGVLLKLVHTNLNYRVLGVCTAAIFVVIFRWGNISWKSWQNNSQVGGGAIFSIIILFPL